MKIQTKSLGHKLAIALLSALGVSAPAVAGPIFTTVDVSSYVDSNVNYNPQTFPIGTTTGNKNTGIPFDLAAYNGFAGEWKAQYNPSGTLDVKVNVSGQASFYALLNNIYGTPGADEYNITIKATNGDSITYQSIGGVDTRDFNANVFTNTIANTTKEWYNNGIGQRMDLREFSLPGRFSNETISDFVITQVTQNDSAIFSGLTFSNQGINPSPEPVSIYLFVSGVLVFGICGTLKRSKILKLKDVQ